MKTNRFVLCLVLSGAGTAACSTTQPVTQSIDDSGTTARVKAQIAADPDLRAYRIDADTVDGVVYLHGEVDEQDDKQEAERIARTTRGVRQVVNQLQIKREGETADIGGPDWDAWITAKVKSRLSVDPEVRAMNIDVDTQDGVVYLTGIVSEQEDRTEAVRLAKAVDGVDKVVDNLRVQGQPGAAMEAQGPGQHQGQDRSEQKPDKGRDAPHP